ncbi:uncharacterized protein SPPG_05828 [Spizellomyces punctatus DAOM BR117]|uniref:NECAP PHear domain-containing protein n=1 Tax=Spizellomyces punctatus (strain DAOM BR117) TaxID=645134 RepID=A0A0L0HDL9_SPIPD|nr:uncharacterized protein SPPG_05828 [Spizellomyces punctatus DAOM BR117]KNC98858.1 hypothetical protein SPPG_05828 [Spizellomyces punctatus DAOM BR117]|eukprot:XP_016606898.1 hypothetical protein SPPG_05828 [Spizellomyces punctatus DAOM BR117]
MADEYESVLLVIRECYVYRVPPRSSTRGYRASDWDVNQHLWTGRLRVIAKGDNAVIQLEDANTGDIFAVSPYDPQSNSVEPVLDSSRYFVLRIVDPSSGHHAFVGMGFPDRSQAFDFNVALQDHVTRVKREKEKEQHQPGQPQGPKLDYSWKEGETISIQLGNTSTKSKRAPANNSNANTPIPFLPPPPSATKPATPLKSQQSIASKPSQPNSGDEWSDFTDFVSSSNTSTGNQAQSEQTTPANVPSGWTTF